MIFSSLYPLPGSVLQYHSIARKRIQDHKLPGFPCFRKESSMTDDQRIKQLEHEQTVLKLKANLESLNEIANKLAAQIDRTEEIIAYIEDEIGNMKE